VFGTADSMALASFPQVEVATPQVGGAGLRVVVEFLAHRE